MVLKLGRPEKWDAARIEKEAEDLLEWAKDPQSFSLERFTCYREEPYTRALMYDLANRSRIFSNAFIVAKEIVRQNREEACAKGEFSNVVYAKTCSFYDREQSLTNESLSAHIKDIDRSKRESLKDDTIDALKIANDLIQRSLDE